MPLELSPVAAVVFSRCRRNIHPTPLEVYYAKTVGLWKVEGVRWKVEKCKVEGENHYFTRKTPISSNERYTR